MGFHIRQGASDPILKMRMVQDGKNDKSSFNELLETADIRFEMVDVKTGEYEILGEPCGLSLKTELYNHILDEYYITYRFTEQQTSKIGKFEGKIIVQFRDTDLNPTSKLILPIREKLYINIF